MYYKTCFHINKVQPIKTKKSNVFITYIYHLSGRGVGPIFIHKTILPLPHVYVYKKTFYKEISEFFVYLVRIKLRAMMLFSIHFQ